MSVTSVRLQPEVEQSLENLAGKLGRSKNWVVNNAVREFVERAQRDEQRWNETLAAVQSVAQGKAVPGKDVHAWLKTWGTADEQSPPTADN